MTDKALLPCPFCGGEYDKSNDAIKHREDCALSWFRQVDLMSISDEAWNTRPATLEQVIEMIAEAETVPASYLPDALRNLRKKVEAMLNE